MKLAIVLVAALAACGSGPAPTCEVVAAHAKRIYVQNASAVQAQLGASLASRCVNDEWSADARRCVGTLDAPNHMASCQDSLTGHQMANLAKDLTEVQWALETHARPAAAAEDPRGGLEVEITNSGGVKVANKPVADGQLDALFKAEAARDRHVAVRIVAAPDAPYDSVTRVIGLASAAGLDVGLTARP